MDFNMIGLNASAYSKGAQRIQPGNSPSLPKAELNDPAETFHSTRSESTTPVVTKPLGLNSSPNAVDFGGALTIELPTPPPNADASAAKEKSAASTASVPTYFTIEQPQVTPESSELKFDFKALSDSPILHYKATWSNPLQSINPMKMSPLGDLLNLSGPNVSQVLMERADAISIEAQQRKAFTQGLKETLTEMVVGADGKAVEKPRKDALPRLQNLVKFLVHGEKPADWAPPQDLSKATALDKLYSQPTPPELKPNEKTSLIESLKDNGAFGDVVKLYEDLRGKDPSFTAYEIPREYYVVALNKLGASRIKDSITESEAMIADRISAQNMKPVSFLEANQRNLYRTMGVNGDVLAGLGKAFKNIHSLAEKQIDSIASNANVAQLVSDLSGVPLEQFKVGNGDRTAKEVGTDKATGKFNERINTLAGRSFSVGTKEYEQNQKDMTDFLESSLGQKLDQIGLSLVSLSTQLQLGKTPVEAVEVLTNRPHQEWALTKKEIVSAASDPFSAVTGRIARGKSFDELSQLATKATGLSTSNVVGQAALRSKMEQVQSAVTQQGSVDPELVSLVSSKTASGSNGKNLLQLSRQALEVSRDYYQAGFGVDFEYYPGINVVYNELALGNTKVAENLIPLVQYSVAREGGAKSTDYWNLATQVELAAIGGQARTAHDVFPRVMRSAKAGWELGTTADNLEKLARQFKEEGKDASVMEFVASKFRQRMEIGFPAPDSFNLENFISDAQKEISAGRDFGSAPIGNARDLERLEQVTEKIMGKSKSFSDAFTSKFVGGSWAFVSKGGVADTVINRPTVAALRQVNSALGFDNLESPDDFATFRDTMHQYIDAKFGLVEGNDRPMEDLLSKIHKDRDKFTENRHELCHSRTSGNGRTNLLTEIALGQSDCRHTDATFQACFDLWKRDQQTKHLQSCLDSIMQGGSKADYQESFDKAQAWNKKQVVSMDMAFRANVQTNLNDQGLPQKYSLKTDEQGRFIRTTDGDFVKDPKSGLPFTLEDHTMPVMLTLDDNGNVTGMRACDPFYRGLWNVGDVEIDPNGILDESKGFYLGNQGKEASDGKPVDLYAVPCGYSGRALGKITGECGQVTLGGLEYSLSNLDSVLSLDHKLKDFTDAVTAFEPGKKAA